MYKFLQNHGKKIMAVMSAGLMIAFIVPSASKYGGGSNPTIARLGDEKITSVEAFNARQSWDLLKRVPLGERGSLASILGPHAYAEIERRPILFLLLQREARQMGVAVSEDQLNELMTNLPGLKTNDPDRNERVRGALGELMLVRQASLRAASAVKISHPMVQRQLAESGQSLTADVADFTTAKYMDKAQTPPPTAEQLKAQFEKFGEEIKGTPSESNPFGFGYKYPHRVKLQYIAIPRSDVRKAVEATRSAYQWEVDSRIYYRQHQDQFKAAPSTQAEQSFNLSSPTTRATTKPFEQARDEIKDRLINEETSKRMNAIRDRIASVLAGDYVAYQNAAGPSAATQPATQPVPASSLGVPYTSFDYLKKVAEDVQSRKELGVLPTVVSVADKWLTDEDLSKLAGIGAATMSGDPMPRYIIGYSAPFVAPEQRGESAVLKLMEPTRPMLDSANSIYIARVTAAEPAHKPATIAEVEPQVRGDIITARAYELAKADAQKLLDQARQKGLHEAAATQPVVTVGPLANQPGKTVPQLALMGPPADRFTAATFKLLSTPTSRPSGKPVVLIELPRDNRVMVAELNKVEAMWPEGATELHEARLQKMLSDAIGQRFTQEWFDYDSVAARTKYKPEAKYEDHDTGAPPPEPAPPLF